MVSRRAFLTGAASLAAAPAFGAAPAVSLRPMPRPDRFALRTLPSLADLVAQARLGGRVAVAVADAATGDMLEVLHPLLPMPPASVTKAITCAYALDRLGPGYRFRTQVLADGTMADGRLDGDLWLVGSGDPLLDTDTLAALVADLRALGLREVTGRLRLVEGALPQIFQIDPGQPAHVGYNPAISGLNLNYNRVHFGWARQAGTGAHETAMDARSDTLRPLVQMARIRVEDRADPLFTYSQVDGRDEWTVARAALGNDGSRWLPVRRPAAYVGDVFQNLAQQQGITLAGVDLGHAAPASASVLAEHTSPPLVEILRDMMRWSTNLTAEVVGLVASQTGGVQPSDLPASAAQMTGWMQETLGARQARFVDHSGLGDASRLRPNDMVRALVHAGPNGMLRQLMRDWPMRDAQGNVIASPGVSVAAKTGTLNFVSSLAGYARTRSGRDLAFAIFSGDLDRRSSLSVAERERPEGGRDYSVRARRLQQALIDRWALAFD